jgi:endonuclease/exonuclease/phosphatase family metal-dependent hydrolase
MSSIAEVLLARRREILALSPDAATHEALLAELGFDTALEIESAPEATAAPELCVAAWNAQRCRDVEAAAALLDSTGAEVFLLSELDHGMARSAQRHTARELAARLGAGFAFGVEFLELGLGDAEERAAHAGSENSVGFHGGAILSRRPFAAARLVRLERSARWFDGARGERRVGGRVAVLCRVRVGAGEIELASVHLENHCDPRERAAQLEVVFDALDGRAPALVGGDVNTHSFGTAELEDRAALRRALELAPRRLAEPWAHEPLFALAERCGFDWQRCNALGTPTHRPNGGGRATLALDWFFARGLQTRGARVVPALDPRTGAPLSDHDAVVVTVFGA